MTYNLSLIFTMVWAKIRTICAYHFDPILTQIIREFKPNLVSNAFVPKKWVNKRTFGLKTGKIRGKKKRHLRSFIQGGVSLI